MKPDLKSMNRSELKDLLAEVKKLLQKIRAKDRRDARKAAAELNLSLDDLTEAEIDALLAKHRKGAGKSKTPPKFADPQNPARTWTGKGRRPRWYLAAMNSGITPDEMRIGTG